MKNVCRKCKVPNCWLPFDYEDNWKWTFRFLTFSRLEIETLNCWSISTRQQSCCEQRKLVRWCFHLTISIIFHIRRLKVEAIAIKTRTILWTLRPRHSHESTLVFGHFILHLLRILVFLLKIIWYAKWTQNRNEQKNHREAACFLLATLRVFILVDVDNKNKLCHSEALLME